MVGGLVEGSCGGLTSAGTVVDVGTLAFAAGAATYADALDGFASLGTGWLGCRGRLVGDGLAGGRSENARAAFDAFDCSRGFGAHSVRHF